MIYPVEKRVVYFMQPTYGGPIRVGTTNDPASRQTSVGSWHPHGIEIIAQFPGGFANEATIQLLLRPAVVRRDWFRACPLVWRTVLDALETGLSWLPVEPSPEEWRAAASALQSRIDAHFENMSDLANATGIKLANIPQALQGWRPSVRINAAIVIRELKASGKLPTYFTDSSVAAKCEAAA